LNSFPAILLGFVLALLVGQAYAMSSDVSAVVRELHDLVNEVRYLRQEIEKHRK